MTIEDVDGNFLTLAQNDSIDGRLVNWLSYMVIIQWIFFVGSIYCYDRAISNVYQKCALLSLPVAIAPRKIYAQEKPPINGHNGDRHCREIVPSLVPGPRPALACSNFWGGVWVD